MNGYLRAPYDQKSQDLRVDDFDDKIIAMFVRAITIRFRY